MNKKEILEKLREESKYRLNYHHMPAQGLLNDPNGLVEKDGVYHVFYQWNKDECDHGAKVWGHYTTENFVEWKIEEIALDTNNYYEVNGCYSGSAILKDDKINLFYTGNVKKEDDVRISYQCLAIEQEDGTYEKIGPVIDTIPEGYTAHFRDPKVWEKEGKYYMVLGAQRDDLIGEIVLFDSENLKDWNFLGSIYNKKDLGYMLECPDIFTLNDTDVLLCSPQGLEPKGDLYNNVFQSGYILGNLDYKDIGFEGKEFIEIDRGFDFYAPQTFVDSKGRRIMYAWMGIEGENHPTITHEGWVHALTLPRELQMKDGKLIQKPLDEMKELRDEKLSYDNIEFNDTLELSGLEGNSYELIVEFENVDAESYGIKLRKGSGEEIVIKFENNRLILDRENTPYLDGVRACKVEGEKHKLHIFMDKSSMELFYGNGEEVFTTRVFSGEDANGIEFFSNSGKSKINKLEFYKLKSFTYFI